MAGDIKKNKIRYEGVDYILQDSRLPEVTTDHNGYILMVVDGKWTAVKQDQT